MGNPDKEFLSAEEMIFKSDCKPIERIYIDLEYMQDLRLGALINMITVQEELKYLVHKLTEYNARYDRQTAKYFKALKMDESRIDEILAKPIALDKICVTAPFTSIYYRLQQIILAAYNHTKAFSENAKPLELVINCSDVPYPQILQDKLCTTLSKGLDIKTSFQSTKRYSLPDNEYLGYDLLMLYDYGEFIKQHGVAFIGNGSYSETRIIAKPYIEEEILAKTEDPEQLLAYTEKNLDVYCEFSYLRSEIWLGG